MNIKARMKKITYALAKKVSKFLAIFVLIFAWVFSGFPQIWQNSSFPPEIQEARADVTSNTHPSAYTLTTGFNGNFNDASYPASNAYSSNDSYASTGFGDKRNKEYATNYRGFDFSGIADNSMINSVNVYIERKVDVANGVAQWKSTVWPDVTVAAALDMGATSSIGNTQYSTSANPTSDTYWNYSMTTLPTVAQLKGTNFGIRVQADNNNSGTDCEYFIDDIYIVVDYTLITISITVSDGGVSYGIVATTDDTTSSGENETQTITNNGDVNEDFNIIGYNSTPDTWLLQSSAGDGIYAHKWCIADCDSTPSWTAITTGYTTLDTAVTPSGTTELDLQVTVPTANPGANQQNVNVTIQAVAS